MITDMTDLTSIAYPVVLVAALAPLFAVEIVTTHSVEKERAMICSLGSFEITSRGVTAPAPSPALRATVLAASSRVRTRRGKNPQSFICESNSHMSVI